MAGNGSGGTWQVWWQGRVWGQWFLVWSLWLRKFYCEVWNEEGWPISYPPPGTVGRTLPPGFAVPESKDYSKFPPNPKSLVCISQHMSTSKAKCCDVWQRQNEENRGLWKALSLTIKANGKVCAIPVKILYLFLCDWTTQITYISYLFCLYNPSLLYQSTKSTWLPTGKHPVGSHFTHLKGFPYLQNLLHHCWNRNIHS
jgi:hypothetical protein